MANEKNKKKYLILRDEIIAHIKSQGLQQNDKLPTVRELIKNSDFSYATVHRTLIEMENEGLITKRQGKGLYVNRLEPQSIKKHVALIIPDHFSSHKIFIDILKGVKDVLGKANIGLLISISNMSHEREKETIAKLIYRNIDGIIIFLEDNYMQDFSHIAELKERNFPFVLIDRYIPEFDADYVAINNKDAMYKICSYLKYNKHCDKIIFVPEYDSPTNVSSSVEKLAGYNMAVKLLYGNDEGLVLQFEELIGNIESLCSTYQNLGISFNHDAMIPELHKRLHEQEKVLPPNCHVFGYNNSFEIPTFPTVEQFNDQVGIKAAQILVDKFNNPNKETVQIKIEPKLILPNGNGGFYQES